MEANSPISISFTRESIVNERTGVTEAPSEYVENLRALERSIQRYDDDVARIKADLKVTREAREKAVAAMREAIREGKVLPLLESDSDEEDAQ